MFKLRRKSQTIFLTGCTFYTPISNTGSFQLVYILTNIWCYRIFCLFVLILTILKLGIGLSLLSPWCPAGMDKHVYVNT